MSSSAPKYDSPYVEGQIALAASVGDWDEVTRLVRTMLPGEQRAFQRAVEKVDAIIQKEIDAREDQG